MSTPFSPRVILVTGGAGFIGSNLCRWLLEHEPSVFVINLDLLTYAGNLESLRDVEECHGRGGDGRYHFVRGDIRDAALVRSLLAGEHDLPRPDALLHLAAESHVDRSILGAADFVSTNVVGTHTLLAAMRDELGAEPREFRFVNVSTDEVYGSLGRDDPPFTERTPLAPNSPYSASKAGADCLVRAYHETFGLPCVTTRCSNNYGPYQFPEKLVPLIITKALANEPLPIYGDGQQRRDWLHVVDHCAAIWAVCTRGDSDQTIYNIGACAERANIDVVRAILARLGRPDSLVRHVTDRPGHDRRYAMDVALIESRLGWTPSRTFEDGLNETIDWYVENEPWWRRVQSEAYRASHALYPEQRSR
jgi:dTDP-glucose 4,6-dehydratase